MGNDTIRVIEERLRGTLADTLDNAVSKCAVLVAFNEEVFDGSEQTRQIVGVPYEISNGCLIVGPYFKDLSSSPPADYEDRKKAIPINMILGCRRI